jgi:transcriptional regulator with XRE-family HTH domain
MADVRVLLAQNMKRCREILALSQMDLAEKVGCSSTLIGKIEIMKRFPSADNLNRIANALKVEPADLFTTPDDSRAIKAISSELERKTRLKKKVLQAIDEALEEAIL